MGICGGNYVGAKLRGQLTEEDSGIIGKRGFVGEEEVIGNGTPPYMDQNAAYRGKSEEDSGAIGPVVQKFHL